MEKVKGGLGDCPFVGQLRPGIGIKVCGGWLIARIGAASGHGHPEAGGSRPASSPLSTHSPSCPHTQPFLSQLGGISTGLRTNAADKCLL